LGGEVRKVELLLCYNNHSGIIDEEKDIIFATQLELFSIRIISLPKTISSMKTIDVEIMDADVKTSISKQGFEVEHKNKDSWQHI